MHHMHIIYYKPLSALWASVRGIRVLVMLPSFGRFQNNIAFLFNPALTCRTFDPYEACPTLVNSLAHEAAIFFLGC